MHGLINSTIAAFLRDSYGDDALAATAARAEIDPGGFEPFRSCPERLTLRLIAAAAETLGKPEPEFLEDLGYHYLDPRIDSLEEFAVSLVQSRRKGFMDPAWDYLRDENGEQLVSAWYRLEEIAECWPAIAARSHLRAAPLPYRNAMGYKKPGAVWTEAAVQAVRDVYAEDFSRFGYADDAPPERHRPADAASE